jgi:hypothetical protein
MNEFISAVQNQTTGVNKNIKLSDNTYAYINSQGIAKKFNNMAEYIETKEKNGCPADAVNVARTWENVQYRVGTPMMAGQSCGNENKIVVPKLAAASTEFDKAYYEQAAGKPFTTIEEATSDWQNAGRLAGLAPFDRATAMQDLGKMGYIDVDSIFHEMTPVRSTTYNGPSTSYVKGTSMRSCLPPEGIKFRDRVYIKYGDSYLYSNNKRTVKVSPTKPSPENGTFYIQVPLSEVTATTSMPSTAYNYDLTYGAKCLLSMTNEWNQAECGYWGCNVGKIFETTFSLADSKFSNNLKFVSSTGIATDTPIQYGEQFYIEGRVYKNALKNGEELTTLTQGNYVLSFTGNQLIIKNTQTGTIEVLKNVSVSNSPIDRIVWLGNSLRFYDSNNNILGSYMGMGDKCTGQDCILVLTSTGLLKVVDSTWTNTLKKSNESIPDITDPSSKAYATIVNGELAFTENSQEKKVFSIEPYLMATNCSLSALQTNCNNTANCIGFIHSPTEHTWQKIQSTDLDTDYKISPTNTHVYLRNVTGSLTGDSCPTNSPFLIDRKILSSYPKGRPVNSSSANCTAKPPLVVPALNNYLQGIETTLDTPVNPPVGLDKLNGFPEKIGPLLSNYETNYSSWTTSQGQPTALSNTLKQRTIDTYTLDQHYRSMAILWGVITLVMILIILFRPRN